MDLHCRIEMLGPLRVVEPGRTLTRFGTQKAGFLLAFLALRAGRAATRETLIDLFWPDMDLAAGRDNLSTTLSALRRLLEPPGVPRGGVLRADRADVCLNAGVVGTDVAEFEKLCGQARQAGDAPDALGLWERAAGLYRGDFLPGCYLDWAVREGERLQGLYVGALAAWTQGLERAGDGGGALEAARRWAGGDPYSEEAQEALIRLLVRAGRMDAARDAYDRLERMMRDEFGTMPSPAAQRLAAGLAAAAPRAPEPVAPTPHHPAPAAAGTPTDGGPPAAPLPASFSRFFGRESELALLGGLLSAPGPGGERTRLVTVTGPGGLGKTRLATEFARRSDLWAGFVPLADLSAADLIVPHVAQALRLPTVPGARPLDGVAGFFAARAALDARPALLILDNLEQIDGAGAAVGAMLERVPTLLCLCTSRRRLGLRGERLVPLAPLAVPYDESPPSDGAADAPGNLMTYPSVRLYVDRAQAARPDFGVTPGNAGAVAGLCRALEGSPLALELAASWVRSLPPRAMWERLAQGLGGEREGLEARYDDLPSRHRSLWAALDWSFRLLTPGTQRLFARVSVFRGGWTTAMAEIVCDEPDALRRLADLEDASLVRSAGSGDDAPVRWHILETVRQHAHARLRDAGDAEAVAGRHLDAFLALAEGARMEGGGQARWLDTLEAEHDNLRGALDWAATDPDAAGRGLRLAAALLPFWRARGPLAEGQRRTALLLARPGAAHRGAARAAALNGAGVLAMLQSDYPAAGACHEEALAIGRETADVGATAAALLGLGNARFYSQDWAGARPLFQESLALREGMGDAKGVASALHSLGNVAYREERFDDAVRCFERALDLRRGEGDALAVAASLGGLGQVATAREEYPEATRLIREALRVFAGAGQQWTVALCLENLGRIAEAQGRTGRAVRLLGAGAALRERSHFAVPPAERAGTREYLDGLRAALGGEAFDAAWAAGRGLTWAEAVTDAQDGQATPSIRS